MINMLKNKVDFTGVAVLLLAFFVAVGFKAPTMRQQPQWYGVEDTGSTPGNPQNQQIGEALDEEPTGDCNTFPGVICAIELDLDGGTPPSTVHEAQQMGVTTGNSRQRQ
ncbi:hypothetical protein [Parapedobacter koreensis]|uniref:Uncharacterized protein n=1 Tax=Parapedobacter koreensis TaxID=332977 RepID=A0A1H7RAU9_9SPHI|nr:hypothetical protein [Parapedobacter koreensis]SEL57396.1 hypothetical protein SAMN05421740_1075 [Parapedobacter koreensis]